MQSQKSHAHQNADTLFLYNLFWLWFSFCAHDREDQDQDAFVLPFGF